MPYLTLLIAIVLEVAGSLMLRLSHGFERLGIGVLSVVLFILSLGLLSVVMRSVPVSVSYPLWAGLGTVGALVGGRLMFAEPITALQVVGVVVVLAGAVIIRVSQVGQG